MKWNLTWISEPHNKTSVEHLCHLTRERHLSLWNQHIGPQPVREKNCREKISQKSHYVENQKK